MFAYQTTSETSRDHDPSDGRGCKHTHAARVKAFMTVVLKKPQLWLHARLRTWCIAYTNEPVGQPRVSASG
jgi:hypothetical protein